jgi:hypothetical protein
MFNWAITEMRPGWFGLGMFRYGTPNLPRGTHFTGKTQLANHLHDIVPSRYARAGLEHTLGVL